MEEQFHWHQDEMLCKYLGVNVSVLRGFPTGKDPQLINDYENAPGMIGCTISLNCAMNEVPCVRALIDHPERYLSYETIESEVFRDFLFEHKLSKNDSSIDEGQMPVATEDQIHPKFT